MDNHYHGGDPGHRGVVNDRLPVECPACHTTAAIRMWCGHKLCQECATRWFITNPTCPVCGEPVYYPQRRRAPPTPPGLPPGAGRREERALLEQAINRGTPPLIIRSMDIRGTPDADDGFTDLSDEEEEEEPNEWRWVHSGPTLRTPLLPKGARTSG